LFSSELYDQFVMRAN